MANLPQITDLFSKLAFHLQTPTPTSDSNLDLSISNLNQSLNFTHDTQIRVLDTALSLMCFKAPQVFDSMIECLVNTIVSVLSSSIRCEVLRLEKDEVLQIGSSISKRKCFEFIEVVNDIVPKLEQHGMPCHLLVCAVARAAVSASCCRYLVPSRHILDFISIDRKSTAVSKLLCCSPQEFSFTHHKIPTRLLSWYLDPLTLKHDISNILQDITERPFLSLNNEFYGRMEWRSILICLVLSPTMFIHSKALLHNWFMLTGLASILELLIELVSLILDVLSRPTWWGITMELGSRLPYSNAYFPYNDQLLRTLAGPLSSLSFLQLVHGTCESNSLINEEFGLTHKPSAVKIASVDPKSVWALAICFPDWFYFASVLLFSKSFQSRSTIRAPKFGQIHDEEQSSAAAARYMAWILSPSNQSQQGLLFDSLIKISEFWMLRQIGLGISRRKADCRKKVMKFKCSHIEEKNECNCQDVGVWLEEFQGIMKYGNKSVNNSYSEENSYIFASQNHMLFRRIPLGILIDCPCYVTEDGFELLLHYAATGRMLHLLTKHARMGDSRQNPWGLEDLFLGCNNSSKKEAIAGACLVFSLTDIVERLGTSLSDNEESRLETICQVKLRASKYLIKCLKRLIQLNIDQDGDVMLMDLNSRLERWRQQGQEILKINKDLDDAIKGFCHKL